MFNPADYDAIKTMMLAKHPDAIVVPMYVRVYKDTFLLNELDAIPQFNPVSFRVGFGATMSMFDKHSFPRERLYDFEHIATFYEHDETRNVDKHFFVFESTDIESPNDDLDEQITHYYKMLFDYVNEQWKERRKKMIEEAMKNS